MRLRVDEGVYIDMINLHADAGTEAGDETARTANIKQVQYTELPTRVNAHKRLLGRRLYQCQFRRQRCCRLR